MEEKKGEIIDAHHHLWRYSRRDYSWIDDSMSMLQNDFFPSDLEQELAAAGVEGAVAVQARQTIEETDWLLSLAEKSSVILGVVGWAPIASESFPAELARLQSDKKLKGLRHVIQDEPDDNFINRADFSHGIEALSGTGLVYDILIFEKHLPAAAQFVDRHPNQVFVLDHIAKPKIRDQELEPWARNITELARRPNVYCKLSGMATEANWDTWRDQDLRPYVETVLNAFTPARLMFGSDWPVCLLATTYRRWFETLKHFISKLSEPEQKQILGATAMEVYHLGE
jgi:L-fuconolactonase